MIDRYSKLAQVVETTKSSFTQVGNSFMDQWITTFGILCYVPTDNSTQSVRNILATTHGYLGFKHLTTTTYHPQTKEQVKRNSKTIVTRLTHYISNRQRIEDIFVQLVIYAYNTQAHQGTNTSSSGLVLNHLQWTITLTCRFWQTPSSEIGILIRINARIASSPIFYLKNQTGT